MFYNIEWGMVDGKFFIMGNRESGNVGKNLVGVGILIKFADY